MNYKFEIIKNVNNGFHFIITYLYTLNQNIAHFIRYD